jgi:hypothetical protein
MQEPITHTHISLNGNNPQNSGMDDIYAIRRKNLNFLCQNKAEGNQSELARQLDKAQPLINQYLTGGKKIGDDIAREAEERYRLEPGWLDNRPPSTREEILLNAFRRADESVRGAVERVLGLPFKEAQLQQALTKEGGASRTAPY